MKIETQYRAMLAVVCIVLLAGAVAQGKSKYTCDEAQPAGMCTAANTCGSATAPCTIDITKSGNSSNVKPGVPNAKSNQFFCIKKGTTNIGAPSIARSGGISLISAEKSRAAVTRQPERALCKAQIELPIEKAPTASGHRKRVRVSCDNTPPIRGFEALFCWPKLPDMNLQPMWQSAGLRRVDLTRSLVSLERSTASVRQQAGHNRRARVYECHGAHFAAEVHLDE